MVGRVLLVEDDAGFRLALAAALRDEGVEVVAEAEDTQGALREVKEREGELTAVVTDYELEGSNGLTLVRAINAAWPGLAVVLITGHDDPVVLEAARAAGASASLTKTADLAGRLADVLVR